VAGSSGKWCFWVDRGGTFTDIVARDPEGCLHVQKRLSKQVASNQTSNESPVVSPALSAIRDMLGTSSDQLPVERIAHVKMGTTVATNALLERKGAKTVLLVTRGFRDALRIGTQNRPDLFDLDIKLPQQLYSAVLEVDERIGPNGDILIPLCLDGLKEPLIELKDQGTTSVALCFLHGYRFPEHERQVGELCTELGFEQVSLSSQVNPLVKWVPRARTTVVDAYLDPILKSYLNELRDALGSVPLYVMQSHGGLRKSDLIRGKDTLLSGPAGGVVGMTRTAREAQTDRLIGFDMGGTSTDVCLYAGSFERTQESTVAGMEVRVPTMQIHTVAAGGGSILKFEDKRFQVGPQSAGAEPGPRCYGLGGPLTVTDIQVQLGRLRPEFFPKLFGPNGNEPIQVQAVNEAFASLSSEVHRFFSMSDIDIAEGFMRVAVENMANAIKKISVQKGFDVTEFTLACFGGAAGQHACQVADALGMRRITVHPLASVLSAYGMGLADIRTIREHALGERLHPEIWNEWNRVRLHLEAQVLEDLDEQGLHSGTVHIQARLFLRYEHTDRPLAVAWGSPDEMKRQFEKAHKAQFGFLDSNRPLVAEYIEVEAIGEQEMGERAMAPNSGDAFIGVHPVVFEGKRHQTPFYHSRCLAAGEYLEGPVILVDTHTTVVVEPGWRVEVVPSSQLVLERTQAKASRDGTNLTVDPVLLEVFNNLFMNIAERMGVTLAHTASSVNIKERLDFSCALFDREAGLVANAPHMPVHLGSMGESVREVVQRWGKKIARGDVFALNAPYRGGTHLPDITVVSPVFRGSCPEPVFFVAARGHHADVGGLTPGSMPPFSRAIEEEGVILDAERIVHAGNFEETRLRNLLTSGPYPSRNVEGNLADLKAQIAANNMGIKEIQLMMDHFGTEKVLAYMGYVQANAEQSVRDVLKSLRSGHVRYTLDQGLTIEVRVNVDGDRAVVDFSGTSPQSADNFNAPRSVCRAAVLYVFRSLVQKSIPLNEGCLRPIEIHIPEGCFLNPREPAPVVAGNVETSQAIVNALLLALGAQAGSQGTMNNLTFGDEVAQYYETICGGAGAGPTFHGCAAVHTHMTNSRLTDPEILEIRYPIQVESFAIRSNSGGEGQFRGGDGVVRVLRFIKPMHVAILSSHRIEGPPGLNGGKPGRAGSNRLLRLNGEKVTLKGADQAEVQPGDRIVIETPGGGGFGNV